MKEVAGTIEVPQQERKYVLMYLAVTLDDSKNPLTRRSIHRLADVLYQDRKMRQFRSLREICEAAKVFPGGKTPNNPFFNHTALAYSMTEMDRVQVYSVEPRLPTDTPRRSVDVRAGDGPTRPILLDLYSLESLGIITVTEKVDEETFLPLHAARSLTKTKSLLYDHAKWHPDVLLVTEAHSWYPYLRTP